VKKSELAHILRAACSITGDPHILVIGSQSILGSFSEDELPSDAPRSIEADVAFLAILGGTTLVRNGPESGAEVVVTLPLS